MNTQQSDLSRYYLHLIDVFRKQERLLDTPLSRLQRLMVSGHEICGRRNYLERCCALLGTPMKRPLRHYLDELLANEPLGRRHEEVRELGLRGGKLEPFRSVIEKRIGNVVHYYAMARETMPEVVVETGTASGSMAAWILAALSRNGKGRLISIDIPPVRGVLGMDTTVSPDNVGFMIPSEYRSAWTYIMGDAKLHLPKVLADNPVDYFIHDSLHTRTHMAFELHLAKALTRPGAVIVSDDVLMNGAFFSFTRCHRLESLACISNPNNAITVNRFDAYEQAICMEPVRDRTTPAHNLHHLHGGPEYTMGTRS